MNIKAFPSGRAEVRGSVVRIQDTAFFMIFFESAIYFIAPRLGGSVACLQPAAGSSETQEPAFPIRTGVSTLASKNYTHTCAATFDELYNVHIQPQVGLNKITSID